jgi:hypothetical protein
LNASVMLSPIASVLMLSKAAFRPSRKTQVSVNDAEIAHILSTSELEVCKLIELRSRYSQERTIVECGARSLGVGGSLRNFFEQVN